MDAVGQYRSTAERIFGAGCVFEFSQVPGRFVEREGAHQGAGLHLVAHDDSLQGAGVGIGADFNRARVEGAGRGGLGTVEGVVDGGVALRAQRSLDAVLAVVDGILALYLEEVFGVVEAHGVVDFENVADVVEEPVVVFILQLVPLHFAQSGEAGENHVFELVVGRHVFGPDVGLCTQNVLGLLFGELLGHGVELVDQVYRVVSADGEGFALGVARLVVVEVERTGGGHDDVVSLFGSFDTVADAAPRHDGGMGREAALHDFVPTDHLTAVVVEEFLYALGYVALQVVLGRAVLIVFETQLLDAGLAGGALLPTQFGALVAADMNVFRGENIHHLEQYVFDKFEGLVLTGAEHIVADAPLSRNLIRATGAAQLGVGGQGGHHVAGQVDFGDDGDTQVGGILHDVAQLVLRIESAVGGVVVVVPLFGNHRFAAHAAHLGQAGVFLDFDAPALVVGEVPVQRVELVHGHDVENAFHLVGREEVAGYVQVEAAVSESRSVVDGCAGNRPVGIGCQRVAIDGGREQLFDGLQGKAYAVGGSCGNFDFALTDVQAVSLVGQIGVCLHHDGVVAFFIGKLQLHAAGLLELVGKLLQYAGYLVAAFGRDKYLCPFVKGESPRYLFDVVGVGNQVVTVFFALAGD